MRLLLNIGNTHTQIAPETDLGVGEISTLDSPRLPEALPAFLQRQDDPQCRLLAACVVPALRQALQERLGERIAFVSCRAYPNLDFSSYDTTTLGADRIANAAAAVHCCGGAPVLVLDCGSAITSEAVAHGALFCGGVILPGRALQRRALAAFTAQLPEIPLDDDLPAPCGKNTAQAIQAGVDLGLLGAVREIIARTRALPEFTACSVLAVGGDAPFFVRNIPGLVAGPADFTLQGVRLAQL